MDRLYARDVTTTRDGQAYYIYNSTDQCLGMIKKHRVGRFMHWCFFPSKVENIGDLWFSNGCLKEISQFITSLYVKSKAHKPSNTKSPHEK
jgi:hypothetical protein